MVNFYQGLALAIVVLMVASMVGYSFLTAPDTTPTDETPETIPDGTQVIQTPKEFTAEGVEAEVVQLFPVVMVTAATDETEINVIDSAIYSIPGVNQVTSQFQTDNFGISSTNLVYIGTVVFDETHSKQEILEAISELDALTVVEAVQTGLVKVPVETRLQAADDENTFKDYRFEEPFMEAILAFDTQKDDRVEVLQRFIFNGDQVLQSMVFETKNLTGETISFGVRMNDIELVELEPEFSFSGALVYDGSNDFSWLKDKLEGMDEVESAEIEVQPILYQVSLPIDVNMDGQVLTDLNYALHGLEGVKQVKFWHRDGYDEITLDFEAGTDYAQLKSEVNRVFGEAGASYQELWEPVVNIFGTLETNVTASQDFNQSFNLLMRLNKFYNIDLMQKALVDLATTEFVGPDILLQLDGNETVQEAHVFTGHKEKDLLELDVSVYGARDKVTRINAFEAKKA